MKLFSYGFWSGFIDKTNPVNISFFIDLFKKIFQTDIELGSFEDSEILLETIFCDKTVLFEKKWEYTFLFSGESRLNQWHKHYNCILYGEKNHDNIINVPLFIPFLHCSNKIDRLVKNNNTNNNYPDKNICAIISNSCGAERNYFLEQLDKKITIDYAGGYKTNVPKIEAMYNTQEFIEFVSQYKFIITMENSRGETYITEKITHGFNAGTIPIYWGSLNICDYFNNDRFFYLKNINDKIEINDIINKIVELVSNKDKYIEIVNKEVYNNNKLERNVDTIANDIKNLLFYKPYNLLTNTFLICSPLFEPKRFERLNRSFKKLGFKEYNMSFICPTFKNTITQEIMNKHVKNDLIHNFRPVRMKKSEISLFLNYKAILEYISKNYSCGIFCIFESDVLIIEENIKNFEEFISSIYNKKDKWDLIHIGSDLVNNQYFTKPYCDCPLPYRYKVYNLPESYVEDITNVNDKFRLVRKFHTRCTDSFIWNYTGVIKFLNYMNNNYFDAPFDYYMTNFFETNLDFKHYWSLDTFFLQGSNHCIDISEIQNDKD